jgi:hypothetical protein
MNYNIVTPERVDREPICYIGIDTSIYLLSAPGEAMEYPESHWHLSRLQDATIYKIDPCRGVDSPVSSGLAPPLDRVSNPKLAKPGSRFRCIRSRTGMLGIDVVVDLDGLLAA